MTIFGMYLSSLGLMGPGLVGCQAVNPARHAGPVPRAAHAPATQAESVFLTRPAAERFTYHSELGPEDFRRDDNLGYRPPVAITALDAWPQPARPQGDRVTRLRTTTNPNSLTIFRSAGDVGYRGGYRGYRGSVYRGSGARGGSYGSRPR
ncbi:MAG: hypothetical protein AAF297_01900 [Planctomycetota bacterium]